MVTKFGQWDADDASRQPEAICRFTRFAKLFCRSRQVPDIPVEQMPVNASALRVDSEFLSRACLGQEIAV